MIPSLKIYEIYPESLGKKRSELAVTYHVMFWLCSHYMLQWSKSIFQTSVNKSFFFFLKSAWICDPTFKSYPITGCAAAARLVFMRLMIATQCFCWTNWTPLRWDSFIQLLANIIKTCSRIRKKIEMRFDWWEPGGFNCHENFHPRNHFQVSETKMSTPNRAMNGKLLTKQLKEISLWLKTNYTRNWEDFQYMIICFYVSSWFCFCFVCEP